MLYFKALFTLCFAILLSACNSTQSVYQQPEKKPLVNDLQLLASLLNRPMTADQALMLQFTQLDNVTGQQQVAYINILGEKKEEQTTQVVSYQLTPLWQQVFNDTHAVMIQGAR